MATMICEASSASFDKKCVMMRTSANSISISTKDPINDKQMEDLYWICSLMINTGMNLKDIMTNAKSNSLATESTPKVEI